MGGRRQAASSREQPRPLRRPLLKPAQAEAMRDAVRQLDELIILAAMPDLWERVAFPRRVREQTVARMWQQREKRSPRRPPTQPRSPQPRSPPRARAPPSPPPVTAAEPEEQWRPPPPKARRVHPAPGPARRTLREVLPPSSLRRVTLVAALSQWRLVVAQRSRHVLLLARALGACRARVFRAWQRAAVSLRRSRRATRSAAAAEAAAADSTAAAGRVARAGSWPRLLGEAQATRSKVRDHQRWRELEARAVIRGWSVLARRGRVLREWPWVVRHSVVLRRCVRAWECYALGGGSRAEKEEEGGMLAVASAAPFVQRLVRPS